MHWGREAVSIFPIPSLLKGIPTEKSYPTPLDKSSKTTSKFQKLFETLLSKLLWFILDSTTVTPQDKEDSEGAESEPAAPTTRETVEDTENEVVTVSTQQTPLRAPQMLAVPAV